jgi:dienelactone hydrolase
MTREHMNDAMRAQTITIPAADGAAIEAYYAEPERGEPHGSVVVIHHAPGYDEAAKEIARRFAAEGFAALCPNLYTGRITRSRSTSTPGTRSSRPTARSTARRRRWPAGSASSPGSPVT